MLAFFIMLGLKEALSAGGFHFFHTLALSLKMDEPNCGMRLGYAVHVGPALPVRQTVVGADFRAGL